MGAKGMHKLESSVSYSPPRIGGVAAHQENAAKPPLKAQTGWSFQTDHPGRALLTFDGTATPPVPGGDYAVGRFQFNHPFKGRRFTIPIVFAMAFMAGCA